jgi:hypothetical protein
LIPSDWKYEKEWRYIDYEIGSGKYQLSERAIRQIILGARISKLDESRVIKWVDQLEPRPNVFRASISPNFFKVELHPYVQT